MSTRDSDAKPPRLFDVRTIERNIKKGLVTRKDYEKHLKSLEDAAAKIAAPDDDEDLDDADDQDVSDESEGQPEAGSAPETP